MKAKPITLVLALVLIASVCFSKAPIDSSIVPENNEKRIRNYISQHMGYPEFAKDEQNIGVVMADISINKEGKVEFNEIYGHNEYKEYVMEQLKSMTFSKGKFGAQESILFKFTFD